MRWTSSVRRDIAVLGIVYNILGVLCVCMNMVVRELRPLVENRGGTKREMSSFVQRAPLCDQILLNLCAREIYVRTLTAVVV